MRISKQTGMSDLLIMSSFCALCKCKKSEHFSASIIYEAVPVRKQTRILASELGK